MKWSLMLALLAVFWYYERRAGLSDLSPSWRIGEYSFGFSSHDRNELATSIEGPAKEQPSSLLHDGSRMSREVQVLF